MRNPHKILVVRRDNIGDLVCTTPAFAALRKRFPDAEIGALVNSYNAEVLRGNPNVDCVFVYQKLKHAGNLGSRFRALGDRLKLIIKLRRWKPDVTILAKASYDRHGLNFARQIGARNVIGFVPETLEMAKGLPDIQLETPDFIACHEVEAIARLLSPLGISKEMPSLQVFPDRKAVEALGQQLPFSAKRFALNISAREPERQWGFENFVGLIEHLLRVEPEAQVLLFWSPGKANDPCHPGDDDLAWRIVKDARETLRASNRLIPMATQNLTDLIAALSLCDVFIGADGGAMHLATALDLKIIALFENKPDKLKHWYPWGAGHRLIHSSNAGRPEVAQITIEQVVQALADMASCPNMATIKT